MSLAEYRRQKEGTNYASESCSCSLQHEKDTVVEDCSLSREVGEGGHRPWEANHRFLFMVSFSLFFSLGNLSLLPCESTCNYREAAQVAIPDAFLTLMPANTLVNDPENDTLYRLMGN